MSKEVEALKKEVDRLYKLAYYDPLTDLPNRLMFHDASEKITARANTTYIPYAVLLIDLDNFKPINDMHGHAIGDLVLKTISDRLATVLNVRCNIVEEQVDGYQKDKCQCLVARLGGDEFVAILDNADRDEAAIIAEQIVEEVNQVIVVNGVDIYVSASVGVAICPFDGTDVSSLLKCADLAMYVSKEHGKNQYMFYDMSMNSKIEEYIELETMIRDVLRTKQLELHYQPIFRLYDDTVISCEALIRGKLKGKMFSPAKLIEVAEQSNLIIPLGSIVTQKACEFIKDCLDAGHDISVSVNVSAHQIASESFVDDVRDILAATDIPAANLVLEVTETALMRNFEDSSKILNMLQKLGVKISIDDFGKGYSSFSYLQKLPIDKIKIDMSFIETLGEDKKTREIVKGIILMAEALQMKTCAEGVETQRQYTLLKKLGCDTVQGYFKYPALNRADFAEMLVAENLAER
jgi:diguanylate cyclase (GGDEF)-like protein